MPAQLLTQRSGSYLLAALWILLVVVYSAPLWLSRWGTITMHVEAEPAGREWLVPVFVAVVTALPPFLLAAITWWWVRRDTAA